MEQFIVIKKNTMHTMYPYYFLLVAKDNKLNILNGLKYDYPEMEELLCLDVPDANTLFKLLKDRTDLMVWSGCNIFSEVDEDEFIDWILDVYLLKL